MLIDVFCPFYNEEKIVKQIVNYWKLLPIRKIILFDNGTTDSSLNYLKNEFKDVVIINNPDNKMNDLTHLVFKNNAWKYSKGLVDFVLVCDFDEVIWSSNIINSLEIMKMNGGTIAEMVSFGSVCEDKFFPNAKDLMHLQEGMRFSYHNNKGTHKKILFDPNKIEEMNFAPGAHTCSPKGDIKYFYSDIFMFHFSTLGKNFLIEKWKRNAERLSDINKAKKWGTHYMQDDSEIIKYFNDLLHNSFSWNEICEKSINELIKY